MSNLSANSSILLNSRIMSACSSSIVLSMSSDLRKYFLPFLTTRPEPMNLLRWYITVVLGMSSLPFSSLLVTPDPDELALTISLRSAGSRDSSLESRSKALQNQNVSSSMLSSLGLAIDLIIILSSTGMLTIMHLNV